MTIHDNNTDVNNTIDNTIYANKTQFGDFFSEVGKA